MQGQNPLQDQSVSTSPRELAGAEDGTRPDAAQSSHRTLPNAARDDVNPLRSTPLHGVFDRGRAKSHSLEWLWRRETVRPSGRLDASIAGMNAAMQRRPTMTYSCLAFDEARVSSEIQTAPNAPE